MFSSSERMFALRPHAPQNAGVTPGTLRKITAFSETPEGGNPAGVWVGETLPSAAEMQEIAAGVGYSETAFIAPRSGAQRTIKYYSPRAEVPFCGHATIASGLALGVDEGPGRYLLATSAGPVPLDVEISSDGKHRATLTSVEPRSSPASDRLRDEALRLFGWQAALLDNRFEPAIAYAGANHLVLALRERSTLSAMEYDFDGLANLMRRHDLTTLQLVWQASPSEYHVRNPFPVGGVVEDPATGAAAAAFAGYLRERKLVEAPGAIVIHQGTDMGRPSRLDVDFDQSGGIRVRGAGCLIDD